MLCKAHESHILLILPLEVIKTESMIVLTWMIHTHIEKKNPLHLERCIFFSQLHLQGSWKGTEEN